MPIKKPLILIQDRQMKKDAIDMFKLILGYMGDRTIKGKSPEKLALELTTKGWGTPMLRDEIYLQLCKQTTKIAQKRHTQRLVQTDVKITLTYL